MIKAYQIYHNEDSKNKLESIAIPYDNTDKFDINYFENKVLFDLWRNGKFMFDGYVGVVGTRIKEKTGKTLQQFIDEIIVDDFSSDVYVLCSYNSDIANNFWKNTFHPSLKLKTLLNFKYPGILPFTISNNNWVNCYCNYAIMKTETMQMYVSMVVAPLIEFFETTEDEEILNIINTKIEHRGKEIPMLPFFMEGLMGSFISEFNYSYKILANSNDYVSK